MSEGQSVPYTGLLISEKSFREMWVDIRQKNDLKTELQSCLDNRSPDDIELMTKPSWFVAGFALGLLTSIAVIRIPH